MMNDFLQQGPLPQTPADAFAMEHMMQNLQMRADSPAAWAQEYANAPPEIQERMDREIGFKPNPFNPAEFAQFQNGQAARTGSPLSQVPPQFQQPGNMSRFRMMGNTPFMNMGASPYMSQQFPQQFSQNPIPQQQADKGKGRMVELDDENWEAQFAQIDIQDKDIDAEAEAAMERELNEMDRSVLESETDEFGDFESIWKGIQAENAAREAFEAIDERDEHFGNHMGEFDHWDGFDGLGQNADLRDPNLGEYMFEQDNVFKEMQNPFEEGLRIMTEGGNLSLAALAFEAAVQQDPQHIEAWSMLGSAQAQNEKESPAIRALEQTLKLDPNNLGALMGLAVSYTNEGYDSTAYRTLERWLSIKYPSIISPTDLSSGSDIGFTDRHQLHEKVTNHFIAAAQLSPDGEHMDPDVQVGLGVLFYGAEEYDKAVDCFAAALASTESGTSNQRLQIHLLWNRLGATLANSGRSEEAINAYEKALTLNPNFVRARYNLGVSCINIGCYDEAAGHLLGALAMHKVVEREGREKAREIINGEGPGGDGLGGEGGRGITEEELDRLVSANQSTNLYDTLRRVFSQMGRRDLTARVVVGMDVESFRGEFDF